MNHKPRMLAIGTATQDVFLRSEAFRPHNEDGKLYEELPLGAKLDVEEVVFATGGNAMNASVTFARQGLESAFMGVIGQDPAGQVVAATLDNEGVSTRCVVEDDRVTTGYSTILLAPNGERTILRHHSKTVHDDGSPLDLGAIEYADWLYISSVGSWPLLEKIVSRAARSGVQIAFNPATMELKEPHKVTALLDDIAVLLINKDEAQLLFEGRTSEELLRHGTNLVRTIVISDGPRGVVATDSDKIVRAGMYEDVEVIDRTGAGDAFGSGFVAWHALGKSLEDAVTFASANATSVVTKIGATAGILYRHTTLHDMVLKAKDF